MRDGRTLVVMRHAKAGELPGGPDFERALRPRGQRDSEAAGRWLAGRGFQPDAVLCSAARRTRQTWQHVAAGLGAEPPFSAEQSLYQASAADVAELIRSTGDEIVTLLYIGHNPAAAGLVGLLTGAEPDFPTAAIAVLGVAGSWSALADGEAALLASWQPPGD